MTEIEALLEVDAGKTPPGTVAFFLDDGSREFRYLHAALAAAAGLAAGACAFSGGGRTPVTLLLLCGAMLAVSAMPTLRDDAHRDPKRQVVVITPVALIVRDGSGIRTWRLEDLTDVVAGIYHSRPFLSLVDKRGRRHTVECGAYRRGERVRQAISARMALPRPR